jgi:hypothetical protein
VLCPLKFRASVVGSVVSHANQAFGAPVLKVTEPCSAFVGRSGTGNLRILWRIRSILPAYTGKTRQPQ